MIRAMTGTEGVEAVVVCDVCGQRITDSSAGLAHYRSDGNTAAGFQDVFHVHKGSCHQRAQQAHGNPDRPWHELIVHVEELVRNTGTSVKDVVLRSAARRGLEPDRYNRLCEQLDRVCDLLNEDAVLAAPQGTPLQ